MSGRVVGLATINVEGQVIDLCLLNVSVQGYGFDLGAPAAGAPVRPRRDDDAGGGGVDARRARRRSR